jgi:predicted Zn-dependent peptidase
MSFNETLLRNGVRIVTEENTSVRSVALGIWVKAGSRQDPLGQLGIAHFTEHMLFKGTKKRSALQIAKEIDALGGVLNAHTAKEYTAYYIKVLDEHIEKGIDVLMDIFLNSEFSPEELEKEKNVVLQEIKMTEDTPDDYVSELFSLAFFHETPLGFSILGTPSTVDSIKREHLESFIADAYNPRSIVIAGVGNLDHGKIRDLVGSCIEEFNSTCVSLPRSETPCLGSGVYAYQKDLEQVQITLGTHGPGITEEKKWTYIVLNTLLGGGMSSMLFQEAREKLGIVYSIYSYLSSFEDCGVLAIYAGTTLDHVNQALDVTGKQMKKIKQGDFGGIDLEEIRGQIKGHILLSRESTENRMSTLAKNQIYYNRDIPVEEVLAKINSVTRDQIVDLAKEIFVEDKLTIVTLGKIEKSQLDLSTIF